MELQGEKLKEHLIDFKQDLIGMNDDIDRIIRKISKSHIINIEEAMEEYKLSKSKNLKLIKIIENQLRNDFNINE